MLLITVNPKKFKKVFSRLNELATSDAVIRGCCSMVAPTPKYEDVTGNSRFIFLDAGVPHERMAMRTISGLFGGPADKVMKAIDYVRGVRGKLIVKFKPGTIEVHAIETNINRAKEAFYVIPSTPEQ